MLWNLPYLELSKTFMDLMVWKHRFATDMSNKLMTFRSSRLAEKGYVWKELGYHTGKDGGGSRHSFTK